MIVIFGFCKITVALWMFLWVVNVGEALGLIAPVSRGIGTDFVLAYCCMSGVCGFWVSMLLYG